MNAGVAVVVVGFDDDDGDCFPENLKRHLPHLRT